MEITQDLIDQLSQSMVNHSIARRAVLMYTLLTGYSLFDSIQIKKNCTKCNITYKDAEFIATKLEEIMGIDVNPSKFLFDKNQLADDLIDDYQDYQSLLANCDEKTRLMIISFYHYLFHYRKIPHEVVETLLVALSAFLNYIAGNINKKELKNQIVNIDLIKQKTIIVDSMYARHNFICIEKDFYDICLKKANRILKQAGEDPLGSYSIDISI